MWIFTGSAEAFIQVGLAQDQRTGTKQALDDVRVAIGWHVAAGQAAGRGQAGDLDIVLDRDRHAVEAADRLAGLAPAIRRTRSVE